MRKLLVSVALLFVLDLGGDPDLTAPFTWAALHPSRDVADAGHPEYRLHSQLCGATLRASYEIAGREPCLINPQDAATRGIRAND